MLKPLKTVERRRRSANCENISRRAAVSTWDLPHFNPIRRLVSPSQESKSRSESLDEKRGAAVSLKLSKRMAQVWRISRGMTKWRVCVFRLARLNSRRWRYLSRLRIRDCFSFCTDFGENSRATEPFSTSDRENTIENRTGGSEHIQDHL
ncbi:Hypothetical protein NTJ_05656 [Nesidiocoris tenuis]|uniref:Uncharacterized protein n=1 Tax=Nesidiocoris tenuis TaxID=355587 RepID=A0ABN7AKS6_9HEMI|nr:Hypothetical protein NTJ_05656 [Nesidiocoris tenuis]